MQFLLSKLGFPQLRMGGAEYQPYDSEDDDSNEKPELEEVLSAHAVDLPTMSATRSASWHGRFSIFPSS